MGITIDIRGEKMFIFLGGDYYIDIEIKKKQRKYMESRIKSILFL